MEMNSVEEEARECVSDYLRHVVESPLWVSVRSLRGTDFLLLEGKMERKDPFLLQSGQVYDTTTVKSTTKLSYLIAQERGPERLVGCHVSLEA